ncbi:MAG: hypothetical protein E7223_03705 [Clostridiales bacterium]|nr:hypothetical protein [Clostridiales bacterium]
MDREGLKKRLLQGLESGRLAHAYIFEGPKETETLPMALEFAQALLCTGEGRKPCGMCPSCRNLAGGIHEDLVLLQAEASGKSGNLSLKDEKVQKMQERLKKKPLAASRVVAILGDADLLTERAQNRLLKTLEEPPGRDVLILLSENTEHLLPTILSRCVVFRWGEEKAAAGETAPAKAVLGKLCDGKPYYAFLSELKDITSDKQKAEDFLDVLEDLLRDLAIRAAGAALPSLTGEEDFLRTYAPVAQEDDLHCWVRIIEDTRNDLSRNVNAGYALKSMVLRMMARSRDGSR